MKRLAIEYLVKWLSSQDRKPLVIRGARQVGKTWLTRELAKISDKRIIEINFEDRLTPLSLFNSNDPKEIIINLESYLHKDIESDKCILFLDEIQAAPEMLAKLRWFYEKMPELPVIAAGSLLEFLLTEHSFSMPVGRITYMYLEPLSFEEFLLAKNKEKLYEYLQKFNLNIEIPLAIHEQLLSLFKEYIIIGGLPAVVKSWINEHSLIQVHQIQNDLLSSYRDDFSKYKGKIDITRMDEIMAAIPRMLGQKFVYSRVNPDISSTIFKKVLLLLNNAKICHRVLHSAANGVPLTSEIKEKFFKEIYLDVGLCSTSLGINLNQVNSILDINLVNQGGISEQVVGQLLRTINPLYCEPSLFYWSREEKGSNAEIDYVMQHGAKIIPIEVKSGSTGSLKSLHLFMELKKLSLAVRVNSDSPRITDVNIKSKEGNPITYKLLSIPFYLIGQLTRLLNLLNNY